MKILFIGGNGNISWYCTQVALQRGHEVYELNRGVSTKTRRAIQNEIKRVVVDRDNLIEMKRLLENCSFDVVCDFICYDEKRAKEDVELFKNKTKHFVFVSTDAVYKRKQYDCEYQENSEKYSDDIECKYIQGKIRAEKIFIDAYNNGQLPVTIIRPAYTYDTIFPICVGHNCFTAPSRILEGYPLLIVGDGKNVSPFTHSKDFAEAFVRLIENTDTIGDTIQIMSDEYLSWNDQSQIVLENLGIDKTNYYHIPFEDALTLEGIHPKDLMLQRMYCSKFDLEKLREYLPGWKAQVSFEEGFQKTLKWLREDKIRMRYVKRVDDELMKIYERYGLKKNE